MLRDSFFFFFFYIELYVPPKVVDVDGWVQNKAISCNKLCHCNVFRASGDTNLFQNSNNMIEGSGNCE